MQSIGEAMHKSAQSGACLEGKAGSRTQPTKPNSLLSQGEPKEESGEGKTREADFEEKK